MMAKLSFFFLLGLLFTSGESVGDKNLVATPKIPRKLYPSQTGISTARKLLQNAECDNKECDIVLDSADCPSGCYCNEDDEYCTPFNH